jgi:hypothetical protein
VVRGPEDRSLRRPFGPHLLGRGGDSGFNQYRVDRAYERQSDKAPARTNPQRALRYTIESFTVTRFYSGQAKVLASLAVISLAASLIALVVTFLAWLV